MFTMLFALQWVRHLQDGTRQYIEGKHGMNVTFFSVLHLGILYTLLFGKKFIQELQIQNTLSELMMLIN